MVAHSFGSIIALGLVARLKLSAESEGPLWPWNRLLRGLRVVVFMAPPFKGSLWASMATLYMPKSRSFATKLLGTATKLLGKGSWASRRSAQKLEVSLEP